MRIEFDLCHVDDIRIIVKVSAWSNRTKLGSSLGEGSTIDSAESNALKKLKERLEIQEEPKKTDEHSKLIKSHQIETSNTKNISDLIDDNSNTKLVNNSLNIENSINLAHVPVDWSKELASIDFELKRLGWSKNNENDYIKNLIGFSNRSKITSFTELKILLSNLKSVKKGQDPKLLISSNEELIIKSSILLEKLKWDLVKGREFLQHKFNVLSRKDLKKSQLLEFNMLLEERIILNNKLEKN